MKVTKSQLKTIIKEEYIRLLNETTIYPGGHNEPEGEPSVRGLTPTFRARRDAEREAKAAAAMEAGEKQKQDNKPLIDMLKAAFSKVSDDTFPKTKPKYRVMKNFFDQQSQRYSPEIPERFDKSLIKKYINGQITIDELAEKYNEAVGETEEVWNLRDKISKEYFKIAAQDKTKAILLSRSQVYKKLMNNERVSPKELAEFKQKFGF